MGQQPAETGWEPHPGAPALCTCEFSLYSAGSAQWHMFSVSCSTYTKESCPTLCDPMDCSPPGFSVHGMNAPGKNTGVGCHSVLQGIFPTQGLNPPQTLRHRVTMLPLLLRRFACVQYDLAILLLNIYQTEMKMFYTKICSRIHNC